MPNRLVLLAALLAATPALAQGDPSATARQSAANQLGVLEFCQSHSEVGDDAVNAQRDVISRLPPSTASTDSAEALGKAGTFAASNGQQMSLAEVASQRNTTVSALCKQVGSSSLQAAAAYKQNELGTGRLPTMPTTPGGLTAVPGMPAMPSGLGAMPAVPSGPGMTAVPGLPPSPGAPGR